MVFELLLRTWDNLGSDFGGGVAHKILVTALQSPKSPYGWAWTWDLGLGLVISLSS